ncbi:MAG TPA: DUF2397 family protein [Amycolatopsis sp.]|nr:DUF2397 family protein [Amycolatopsis sp.]
MARTDDLDHAKPHLLLLALAERFTGLADNAQAFMASLRPLIDFADGDMEAFIAHKQRLIDYVNRFIADLANRGAEIATLLGRIEQADVDRLLTVAARREAADAAPDTRAKCRRPGRRVAGTRPKGTRDTRTVDHSVCRHDDAWPQTHRRSWALASAVTVTTWTPSSPKASSRHSTSPTCGRRGSTGSSTGPRSGEAMKPATAKGGGRCPGTSCCMPTLRPGCRLDRCEAGKRNCGVLQRGLSPVPSTPHLRRHSPHQR